MAIDYNKPMRYNLYELMSDPGGANTMLLSSETSTYEDVGAASELMYEHGGSVILYHNGSFYPVTSIEDDDNWLVFIPDNMGRYNYFSVTPENDWEERGHSLVSYEQWAQKQDTLMSGSNIKTINEQSLLGSGNIEIGGGGYVLPVASENTLGGVKIGAGVDVDNEGAISVDTYSKAEIDAQNIALEGSINEVIEDLATETAAREELASQTEQDIEAEAASRLDADAMLTQSIDTNTLLINNEKSDRETADAALQATIDALNALFTPAKLTAADLEWQNNWTEGGSGTMSRVEVCRVGKAIYVSGTIKNPDNVSTNENHIFTLPAGFRPSRTVHYPQASQQYFTVDGGSKTVYYELKVQSTGAFYYEKMNAGGASVPYQGNKLLHISCVFTTE